MTTKYYSPSDGGFYSHDVHGKNGVPADAVEITEEEWQQLLTEQAAGKQIVTGQHNRPVTQDRKVVVDIIAARNRALSESDWLVARHRDELELSDSKTTLTHEQYLNLQAWRRALRAVTADMTLLPPRPV